MSRDTIYQTPQDRVTPFEFNEDVATVFDDMIRRSIPFYGEIIQRQAQLIQPFLQPDTVIYDLGCSNGNLGLAVAAEMGETPFRMVGVDSSAPMLDQYRGRMQNLPNRDCIQLACESITDTPLDNAGIVVVNFTLQFLPLSQRDRLIARIFNHLCSGGLLLFSEKIINADERFSDLQQEFYYRFKKENGYSALEISQKRDALENVLIPETVADHLRRLTGAGFKQMDIWFKWFNFCSWICRKP